MHPYNLAILGAGVVASVFGHEFFLLAATLGAEATWLMFADNRWFRTYVDDKARLKLLTERESRVNSIENRDDRSTAKKLIQQYDQLGQEIQASGEHADLLMGDEYRRFEALVTSYVDLAERVQRLDGYPQQTRELQIQLKQVQEKYKDSHDPITLGMLDKTIDLIQKRIRTLAGLVGQVQRTRSQMDLIYSSFQLMLDQYRLFKTTGGINDQIDDVLRDAQVLQDVLTVDDPIAQTEAETPPENEPTNNVRKIRG